MGGDAMARWVETKGVGCALHKRDDGGRGRKPFGHPRRSRRQAQERRRKVSTTGEESARTHAVLGIKGRGWI